MEKGLAGSRVEVRKPLRSSELSTLLVIEVIWQLEVEGWEQTAWRYILKRDLTGIGRGLGVKVREEEESG